MNVIKTEEKDLFYEKYEQYGQMLYRIAVVNLGNKSDAEEALQETFIRLVYKAPAFNGQEHEKAWLIRVMVNICRNIMRSSWRRRVVKMEDMERYCASPVELNLLDSVLALPNKYKMIIHLYYYEDYSVKQISETLQISQSAVKMRLQRARKLLKLEWESEQG